MIGVGKLSMVDVDDCSLILDLLCMIFDIIPIILWISNKFGNDDREIIKSNQDFPFRILILILFVLYEAAKDTFVGDVFYETKERQGFQLVLTAVTADGVSAPVGGLPQQLWDQLRPRAGEFIAQQVVPNRQ